MRLGIVLGAGGYPGWPFQLAVLAEVERYLDLDTRHAPVLVGTSVGAMTALLLRAGFRPGEMLEHARGGRMSDEGERLLHDVLSPPGQLPPALPGWKLPHPRVTGAPAAWWAIAGQGRRRNWVPGAASMLVPRGRSDHSVFGVAADSLLGAWPEQDTWVVALRARDGRRRVFGRDVHTTPGRAVTASSAIPGYFTPTRVHGEAHVDAGVLSTTHADLLVDRDDLDLVVVVPPLGAHHPRSVSIDSPLRWLVNAQVGHEVEQLRAAGHRVAVFSPPRAAVRAMQGDPIRMSQQRIDTVLDSTRRWAAGHIGAALHEALRG